MLGKGYFRSKLVLGLTMAALLASFGGVGIGPIAHTQAAGKPTLTVVSPSDGATITSTDIPAQVQISNFTLSPEHVGMADKQGEGHIHVMLDGMTMGVLFNIYTTTSF